MKFKILLDSARENLRPGSCTVPGHVIFGGNDPPLIL